MPSHEAARSLTGSVAAAATSVLFLVLEDFSTLASPLFAPNEPISTRRTPHLERLARRGAVFQKAYCQSPICNPSRASFLTSRRPSTTRVFSNDDTENRSVPTLFDFLRSHSPGAAITCSGGKVFHAPCTLSRFRRGFDVGNHGMGVKYQKAAVNARLKRAINASGRL